MDRKYVVRFEKGVRIVTIPVIDDYDEKNLVIQAKKWKGENEDRKYIITENGSANIKLVKDEIKVLTDKEIKGKKKSSKSLDERVEVLEKKVGING